MTKLIDGGPAFPRTDGVGAYEQDGMSLRDYFAGQALAGLMMRRLTCSHSDITGWSYRMADAILWKGKG